MSDNKNKEILPAELTDEARPDEELSDEDLEAVAGGDLKDKLKRRIKEMLFNDG